MANSAQTRSGVVIARVAPFQYIIGLLIPQLSFFPILNFGIQNIIRKRIPSGYGLYSTYK